MRVAFLAPEFLPAWGGVGIYSVNLVRELCKDNDIEIHVITPKRGHYYTKKRIEHLFHNRITVHQISSAKDTFFYNLKFQLALFNKFRSLNRKYCFDLVHSANLVHMPDIFLKFRKMGIPCLVTAHTTIKGQVKGFLKGNKNFLKMAPSEKGSILAYPIISFFEKYYLRKTGNLITVSNKFAKQFILDGYKGRVDVTHNGILLDMFDYKKVRTPSKEFQELRKIKSPIILFAGRIITQKGIEVFVRAMKELQDKDVHFAIAGRGDVEQLKRLLRKYRIRKNKYSLLGFVDNHKLPELYKLSSIFVLPSFYENFPISLLEAMAMKCCCISTDVGAVDEIIDNKKNGIIIKSGNSQQLVREISFLLENKQEMNRMAEDGCKKIRKNFTSAIMAEKTKRIYKRILR